MKNLALIAALLLAASPVAAQSIQQPLGAEGHTNNSQIPNTGVICQEEMTATFCNVPTSPNSAGYGSSSGAGSSSGSASSAGAGSNTSSIPACPEFPPANQLCN